MIATDPMCSDQDRFMRVEIIGVGPFEISPTTSALEATVLTKTLMMPI